MDDQVLQVFQTVYYREMIPPTQRQVAEKVGVSLGSVNASIRRLTEAGKLRKTRIGHIPA